VTRLIEPAPPDAIARVTEQRVGIELPFYSHSLWSAFDDWLVHGITGQGADMSLFGESRAADVLPRWRALRDTLGLDVMVHARQVHAADVLVHRSIPPGIFIASDADGHATARPAALLVVTVADCVPIYIVDPHARAIALLHAGWRGVVAGVLERGIDTLQARFGAAPVHMKLHCGPAICGECYEVGPDVPGQLRLEEATHVDLRAVVAHRAMQSGVPAFNISISTHCTRHGDSPFFSHRAGCAERQIAVLGMRA
jgi:YfiH family protein